ncbi:MAG TPA: hypothetical protein VHR45_08705 [Thermoanaerobaculia bacterium]|nr:hypothetical protein [Thermoanaerobaculia bacterium]
MVPTAPGFGQFEALFGSRDGGRSWSAAGAGLPVPIHIGDLVTAPPAAATGTQARPSLALYLSTDQGVFTAEPGQSWQPLAEGLEDLTVHSLAVDPATGTLYAGTERAGGLFSFTPPPP